MPQDPFGGGLGPLEDIINRLVTGRARCARVAAQQRAAVHPAAGPVGRDLTAAARDGQLDPVVGRDDVIDQVVEVLSRRTKNNPVLLGDPGVGKTAIVEGLARRVVDGDVPAVLRDVRVIALIWPGWSPAPATAATSRNGSPTWWPRSWQRAGRRRVRRRAAHRGGRGFRGGRADGRGLHPQTRTRPRGAAADRRDDRGGHRRFIGATRRWTGASNPSPSPRPPRRRRGILRALRGRYEEHHRVGITNAALDAAVALSVRYIRDRFLPDKAIDLVDRAAARAPVARRERRPAAAGRGSWCGPVTSPPTPATTARGDAFDRELDRVVRRRARPGSDTPRSRPTTSRRSSPCAPASRWRS